MHGWAHIKQQKQSFLCIISHLKVQKIRNLEKGENRKEKKNRSKTLNPEEWSEGDGKGRKNRTLLRAMDGIRRGREGAWKVKLAEEDDGLAYSSSRFKDWSNLFPTKFTTSIAFCDKFSLLP